MRRGLYHCGVRPTGAAEAAPSCGRDRRGRDCATGTFRRRAGLQPGHRRPHLDHPRLSPDPRLRRRRAVRRLWHQAARPSARRATTSRRRSSAACSCRWRSPPRGPAAERADQVRHDAAAAAADRVLHDRRASAPACRVLRIGGPQVLIFFLFSTAVAMLQNVVGAAVASGLGQHPLMGVLAGSVTLTGGPATGLAFAPEFEKAGVAVSGDAGRRRGDGGHRGRRPDGRSARHLAHRAPPARGPSTRRPPRPLAVDRVAAHVVEDVAAGAARRRRPPVRTSKRTACSRRSSSSWSRCGSASWISAWLKAYVNAAGLHRRHAGRGGHPQRRRCDARCSGCRSG